MSTIITPKPIDFKLGDYLSQGFDFYKKNFADLLVGVLFVVILSLIPLCGLMAVGNFYKYCRKLRTGQTASSSDIFNFDDFMKYLYLQLILIAAFFVIYLPLIFSQFLFMGQDGDGSVFGTFVYFILLFAFIIIVLYFVFRGFYIPALFSLGGLTDTREAWEVSKIMTSGNILNIFLFSLVISFLSQIGVIACIVGIFITMPYHYISTYFAYEDALLQIQKTEIVDNID